MSQPLEGCKYRTWFDGSNQFGGNEIPKCMMVKTGQVWRAGLSTCICPNGGQTSCERAQELIKNHIPAPSVGKALGLS